MSDMAAGRKGQTAPPPPPPNFSEYLQNPRLAIAKKAAEDAGNIPILGAMSRFAAADADPTVSPQKKTTRALEAAGQTALTLGAPAIAGSFANAYRAGGAAGLLKQGGMLGASVVGGELANQGAQFGAKKLGASDDTAELVGLVADYAVEPASIIGAVRSAGRKHVPGLDIPNTLKVKGDDVADHINFKKLNLDEDVENIVREAVRVNVNNPHLGNLPETPRVLGEKALKARADKVDPASLLDLDIPGLGKGTLPSDVSLAVHDSINSIAVKHAEIQRAAGEAALMEDGVKHAELQGEADRLWKNMSKLVGLDYAHSNEAGRSLWMRRLMARQTTEPAYWLGQISKKTGHIPQGTTPDLIPRLDGIKKAKAKVVEAEGAAAGRAATKAKKTKGPDDMLPPLPGEARYRRLLERMTEDSQARIERAIAQRIKNLQKEHDLRVTRAGVEHTELGTKALKDAKAPKLTPEEQKLVDADPAIQHLQAIVENLRLQQNPQKVPPTFAEKFQKKRESVLKAKMKKWEENRARLRGEEPEAKPVDEVAEAVKRDDAVQRADELNRELREQIAQMPENQAKRYKAQVLASARKRLEDIERKIAGEPPKPPTITDEIKAMVRQDPEVVQAERELSERQMEFAKWMRQFETHGFLETADNIMKANVLSGLKSHGRNIFGNTAAISADEIAKYPSWALDLLISKYTKVRTQAPPLRAAFDAVREMGTTGLRNAMDRARYGMSADDAKKMDLGPIELNTRVFGDNPNNLGNKILNLWSRVNFRALSAEDAFFRSFAAKRALDAESWTYAKTISMEGGLPPGVTVNEYAKMLAADPPAWLQAEVALASDRAVFAEKNAVASALNRAKRSGRGAAKWLHKTLRPGEGPPSATAESMENLSGDVTDFMANRVFMFTTTPTNVIGRVFEYMPVVGAVKPASKAVAEKIWGHGFTRNQQKSITDAFGRQMVGTGTALMALYLWEKGWITGLPTESRGERAVELAAGQPPMSIYNPVLDRWHRINEAAPFGGLMISIVTALEEGSKPKNERLKAERMIGGALGVAQEMPLAQGAEMVSRAMENPAQAFQTYTKEQLGTAVPTLLKDIARATDPVVRSTYQPDAGYLESVKEGLPFARKSVPALLDWAGQEVKSDPTHLFDFTLSKEPSKDPVLREAKNAGLSIVPPTKRDDETGEQYRYRQMAYGRIRYKILKDAVIGTSTWEASSPVARKYFANSILSRANSRLNQIPQEHIEKIAKDSQLQDVVVKAILGDINK